jgi:hypothetical protein
LKKIKPDCFSEFQRIVASAGKYSCLSVVENRHWLVNPGLDQARLVPGGTDAGPGPAALPLNENSQVCFFWLV